MLTGNVDVSPNIIKGILRLIHKWSYKWTYWVREPSQKSHSSLFPGSIIRLLLLFVVSFRRCVSLCIAGGCELEKLNSIEIDSSRSEVAASMAGLLLPFSVTACGNIHSVAQLHFPQFNSIRLFSVCARGGG